MSRQIYDKLVNANTTFAVESSRGICLGGVGSHFYRPWVYPIYTPSGIVVNQEYPHDHPFHNGFFVGQYPVLVNEREANFWMTPPKRNHKDPNYKNIGRIECSSEWETNIEEKGVTFSQELVWLDSEETPMLNEQRKIVFYSKEDATICEMTSLKSASYGKVTCPKTKFGSIGLRIDPRLLPSFGGVIFGDKNHRGMADDVNESFSSYIAYENQITPSQRAGVLLTMVSGERGPWFVRDYGLCTYNPTMNESVIIPEGQNWEMTMRVVAYDGSATDERINDWVNISYN